ncbi:MAG: substrate-binding domain-containing protein [Lachnospiraceae bacterium]|nr:substrate-binding domain-containing protein [Lachnospiraceae bacterium]
MPIQEKEKKIVFKLLLFAVAFLAEGAGIHILSYFVRMNLIFALLFILSFQIPLMARTFFTDIRKRAVCRLFSIILFTSGMIIFLACYGRNNFMDSMAVVDPDTAGKEKYQPFYDVSVIAKLEEPSELQLRAEDGLPVINGSSTLFPLYASIVNMIYPEDIGELNEEGSPFRYGDTASAFDELLSGKTDLVFSEYPENGVLSRAEKQGIELSLTPIGYEAFVFYVNSVNEIESLSVEELQDIYSGHILNWMELGGDDEEIVAFQQASGSRAQERIIQFMNGTSLMEAGQELTIIPEEGITGKNSEYLNLKGAIGFTYLQYASNINIDKGMKLLQISGVEPDPEQIASETYALSDPIYCISVKGRQEANIEKILTWMNSSQGKRLMEKAGYVPD